MVSGEKDQIHMKYHEKMPAYTNNANYKEEGSIKFQ